MGICRRSVCFGLAGAAVSRAAWADDKPASPIAHGALADNSLAQAFEPFDKPLPDVAVWGPDGEMPLAELIKGRTILMPLWAEWCAPCMQEIPDFARLQQAHGNEKFAIIPVLTATQKQLDPASLGTLLGYMHASALRPLIEHKRGNMLARTMGKRGNTYVLPCNLLIGPDGRTVGREIGRLTNTDDNDPAKTYHDAVNRTATGASQSRWGQEDGEAFARLMAAGFLG